MYYVNENVKNLNRIFDQNSREGYLRLDLNENPKGLSNDFIQEVLKDVDSEFVAKYPETLDFTTELGKYIGADLNQICLTNGSAEGIRHIFEAFSRPGGKILSVAPSYAMYEIYAEMYGRVHVPVRYQGMNIDVNEIVEKITDDIDIVVILNPNNPIGNVYTDSEMKRMIAAAKKHEVTVLIDEAYFYFYPNSFVKYALENDFVFVTRTFSKLFSLAGCRLGYVVGKAEGITLIQKCCTPHNVNAFAIKFARTIMNTDGMIDALVDEQLKGKAYLINTLEEKEYELNALQGNFIFIKTKLDSGEVTKRLKEKGILVKHYTIRELKDYIRVTTGTIDIMDKFLQIFLEIDK